MRDIVLFYTLLYFSLSCMYCLPINKKSKPGLVIPNNEQIKFMQKFGYLGGGHEGFEAQYAENAIEDAVINMQKFGGLPQTGILDEKTLELMKMKRCGVKDVINHRQKRFSVITPGWRKKEITYFISNWSPKLGENDVASEIKRALDTWAGYGNLVFIRKFDPSADIIVAFGVGYHGDPFPFDGSGNILAHAFFPDTAYGGDIHFDNDENWVITTPENSPVDTTNFFAVALHELGHSLGLAHSHISSAIMSPYYKNSPSMNLDYDDIMGMYELYIKTPVDNEVRMVNGNLNDVNENDRTDIETFTFSSDDNGLDATTETETNVETTTLNHQITYRGDFETVDEHIRHDSTSKLPKRPKPDNICQGNYDTLAVLRGELFVFKNNLVWRFEKRGHLMHGYPLPLQSVFRNFPPYVNSVNAVYEQKNNTIVFVSGSQYWQYIDNDVFGPLPLNNFGISNIHNIDAIFTWAKNSKTYIFKGDRFWRFSEDTNSLDAGYPKNMDRWRKIPSGIDAVIEWIDGSTYFFKGPLYWRFDNIMIVADKHYPLPTLQYWFGCPEEADSFLVLKVEDL